MAKMTKQEAVEMLKNRKVYVNGKSEEIQKKLFELGFEWIGRGKVLSYYSAPFIFILEDMSLTYDNYMNFFSESEKEEISAEEICSIEIVDECPFHPFDKVLVRCDDDEIWVARHFDVFVEGKGNHSHFACTDGMSYFQCISYKGNEHLHNTTYNPKDKEE